MAEKTRFITIVKSISDPLIVMDASYKNAVECTHMGAIAYLQKPFTTEKIKTVLQELYPNLSNEGHTYGIDRYISQSKDFIEKNYSMKPLVF